VASMRRAGARKSEAVPVAGASAAVPAVSLEADVTAVRALRVIELLAAEPAGLSLSEIARRLVVNKAIAHRLLLALEAANYAYRHELSGLFHLTFKVSNLGLRKLAQHSLLDQAGGVLRGLADRTGEVVRLAVVERDRITWVAASTGPARELRVDPSYSLEIRVHAHAAGKAWLATLPPARARAILRVAGTERLTPHTLTTLRAIEADLQVAAAKGYSLSVEEHSLGVGAIAAPILVPQIDGAARCVGTVSVAAPISRMDRAGLEACAPALIGATQRLAERWPIGTDDNADQADEPQGDKGRSTW
jgi:IclR family acetate operon transcriptional repressor